MNKIQLLKIQDRIKRKIDWQWRKITSENRIMPDFLIPGFPRCGTTSLFNYLIKHECILSPLAKEPSFFNSDFFRGLKWYKSFFPTKFEKKLMQKRFNSKILTGEATPMYIFDPKSPIRIKKILPNVKLIFLLRNPIERAFSHYSSIRKRGLESLSFENAIKIEEERLEGEYEKMLENQNYYSKKFHFYGYLAGGHYYKLLKNWFTEFEKKQILIIKSENMFKNPSIELKKICSFLGISNINLDTYNQYNLSESKLDQDNQKKLKEYFNPHNEELYKFLGSNFDW